MNKFLIKIQNLTKQFENNNSVIKVLKDINLNLDQDYELTVSENDFLIKKFPIFGNKGSKGNISKFN